jgi:hypothetical protein
MADLVTGIISYADIDTDPNVNEKTFLEKADLKEGISGRGPMDTTFENTEKPYEWRE